MNDLTKEVLRQYLSKKERDYRIYRKQLDEAIDEVDRLQPKVDRLQAELEAISADLHGIVGPDVPTTTELDDDDYSVYDYSDDELEVMEGEEE